MKARLTVSAATAAFATLVGLMGPISAFAATAPSLGAAASYGILSDTYTNTVAGTTVNGDIGFTTPPAVVPGGVHPNYGSGAPYATAGVDQGSALTALAAQPCTFTFAPGPIDLSTDTTHGPIGVYTPGVYCSTGAMDIGGPLTLSGSSAFIFRPDGALTSTVGSVVTRTGGSVCNVFWTPTAATTLAATTTFLGTIIDDAGITIGSTVSWTGRALAFGGTVSTDVDTITVPDCAVVPGSPGSSGSSQGTINVVKVVTNDNGGTKTISDFPLFVNGVSVASGATTTFGATAGTYTVTETSDPNYQATFSGDCDVNGQMFLNSGQSQFCILTNDDIGPPVVVPPVPPLINVVKVPSPLSLPGGPGAVTYTYTLRNVGTVAVSNITMVGDTCSPILRVSGDTDNDARLDVTETWVHTCSTTLNATHTNTVVATGWANGLSTTDIASATVIVGLPIVPPLIHVTKIPSPLTLLAGGGQVTYTNLVTNPGTVPLNFVSMTDNKCFPVNYVSGDTDNDARLDVNETWRYTCSATLSATTTNTVTATGYANGLTARDIAIATVVVAAAVPVLPKTGFAPADPMAIGLVAIALLAAAALLYVARKQRSA